MTNTFRAMCAELIDLLDCFSYTFNIPIETSVVTRARALLAEPEAEGPMDQELWTMYDEMRGEPGDWAWVRDFARAVLSRWGRPAATPVSEPGEARELVEWLTMLRDHDLRHDAAYAHPAIADHWNDFLTRAATLLQQQAAPAPVPVPVSERLPGPEDCDAEGRCWLGWHQMGTGTSTWLLGTRWLAAHRNPAVHRFWLPANVLPTPEATND